MLRRIVFVALGLVLLGGAFVSGALVHKYRAALRARFRSMQDSPVVQTNLYNLKIQKLAVSGHGRDGAIDVLGDGLLFVNRRGESWFVRPDRTLQPLTLRVPINVDAFERDTFNVATTDQDRFSVKDLLVQERPAGLRVVASHFYWYPERRCHTLRVSALETTREKLLSGAQGGEWRTVMESECRQLNVSADPRFRHVTLGAGGRLAALSQEKLLVTTGEFQLPGARAVPSDSSGKTFLVDIEKGSVAEYTRGHRNPQGLVVAPDGKVWLTEHAARGGDELNLLRQGADYGAPAVTYGTQYEMMIWPQSKTQGKHEGFTRPVFAWVPSIAPSQLIVLGRRAFPWWEGDFLIGSLESRMLYRARMEEGRVIFIEPIFVGHRIRDLVETPSGSIVLKTDDDFLVFVDNVDSQAGAAMDGVTRGLIVSGQCQSCHSFEANAPSGIGPNLWNIVGRDVAGAKDYQYSPALERLGGKWTAERLKAFVADPAAIAPGTRMQATTRYTEQQLLDLVEYLATLRDR